MVGERQLQLAIDAVLFIEGLRDDAPIHHLKGIQDVDKAQLLGLLQQAFVRYLTSQKLPAGSQKLAGCGAALLVMLAQMLHDVPCKGLCQIR